MFHYYGNMNNVRMYSRIKVKCLKNTLTGYITIKCLFYQLSSNGCISKLCYHYGKCYCSATLDYDQGGGSSSQCDAFMLTIAVESWYCDSVILLTVWLSYNRSAYLWDPSTLHALVYDSWFVWRTADSDIKSGIIRRWDCPPPETFPTACLCKHLQFHLRVLKRSL